ncbi:hypothetical protein GCM10011506_21060 [Marivirga lumbricoides]|uniref:PKD domain-containing protein n=1 Tax=Marivirga lumbricoides TaxID=1046115 RepID=A0ABQ1M8G3_9BACT|nr:hypothetical protein GCM10011506_21060 [Marivirga lumbricoides]
MKKYILYLFAIVAVSVWSCSEEFEIKEAPQPQEAEYSITESSKGENYLNFSNNSTGFIKKWDFGNGATAEGDQVEGYFPFAGDYEVTLTVFSSGGSVSSSETITIEETDPTICEVEFLELLTGGCDQPEGKTWVIDAERSGHLGVGPASSFGPDYYAAQANEKAGAGLYNDEYTFVLNQYQYKQNTNGDVYLNPAQEGKFPGAYEPEAGDRTAPYEAAENINFSFQEDDEGYIVLSFNNNGFIGYNTGVNKYQVLSISENEMFIRFNDAASPDLKWYHRLIRKGYAPVAASYTTTINGLSVQFKSTSLNAKSYSWDFGDGATSSEENPTHTYMAEGTYNVTLNVTAPGESASVSQDITVSSIPKLFPFTFEENDTQFGAFGGTVFNVIDNPDVSGVNQSSRVGEYVKGFEGNWAGIEITLDEFIEFSSNTVLGFKAWSPVTGRALFKLESADGTATPVEVFSDITTVNGWTQLNFDFTGTPSGTYNKIALFMDFDNNAGGTFYVDDIGFATEETTVLTQELLTGGNTKSWVLRPAAGSFGVGDSKGSDNYFPQGADISGDRPCLFNDEFIFKTGGQYEYKTNGDIFAESYMAGVVPENTPSCESDDILNGTDAEAWGSGVHSFSLTPATETTPAYITVRGTGAFIALPKAYNGDEYDTAPPDMDAAVTYEVLDYFKNASGEELTLTIDVGGAFWNFVLIPNQ